MVRPEKNRAIRVDFSLGSKSGILGPASCIVEPSLDIWDIGPMSGVAGAVAGVLGPTGLGASFRTHMADFVAYGTQLGNFRPTLGCVGPV